MTINDINIREYFTMIDTSEYDVFVNILSPVNLFCGKKCKVSNLTFDEIEYMKTLYSSKPTIEDIQELYIELFKINGSMSISESDLFLNESIFTLFKAQKFLQDYIVSIIRKEGKMLSGTPDPKMLAIKANERLSKFGAMSTKIRLAEQFKCDPSDVGKWKYSKVFHILAFNNEFSKVRSDYSKEK